MLLRIAVCDDDEKDCAALLACVHAACAALELMVQTDVFSCGEDFLDAHKNQSYDIVFSDIYMGRMNGMDTMQTACHRHPCQFVFTSVSAEHAVEAFSLNAAHYLLKPLTQDSVREAMERCLSRLPEKDARVIEVKTTRGLVPVSMENIIYIEVLNNVCTIHTEKSSLQTYMSLAALFKLLDGELFIRAQRSFVVNMHYIDSFYFDHIVLQNGREITLSRSRRAELKEQYQQFLFHLARRGFL